ncbi:MAG: gamma-glutamyl-gamma-aminobutyrate hydrolase family protein [Actinomycetota bacterium]|nr:gamma-glutamyl-gamma-aminobutyrate hydrolase family protein [Actinomycetota bacterium]
MILFVDAEHETGFDQPWGEFLLANRTRISYRLEDISGDRCLLQRYTNVDPDLIDAYDIRAMFISGSGTDPADYEPAGQEGLRQIISDARIPIFGFCGGFQLMAETFGRPIEKIGPLEEGQVDPNPDYEPGWKTETGYAPIEVFGDHPLFAGLGSVPVFRHAHSLEIKELPEGFTNYGRTEVTEHQLAVNDKTRMLGTQFHPEYYTDEHPAGRRLIDNFCVWSGIKPV